MLLRDKVAENKLYIPEPTLRHPIVGKIIELEKMRGEHISTEVHPQLFKQLNRVFHTIESLSSARIEGNHTTLADYVQDKLEKKTRSQTHKEIANIETCLQYIERCFNNDPETEINSYFIKSLHSLLTKDLTEEGSRTPGAYRTCDVSIIQSKHTPPSGIFVSELMEELITFINEEEIPQNILLKIAIAHHRFVWIHPFDNGNGRMSRLLTYAMLKKFGFDKVILLNPAAVFCDNREDYFKYLEKADTGTEEGLLEWCQFVLDGLLIELSKIQKLLNKDFLIQKIIIPAIDYAAKHNLIDADQVTVLKLSLSSPNCLVMTKEIHSVLKNSRRQNIYLIQKMTEMHLLQKESPNSRKYLIDITNQIIIRGLVETLTKEGMVSLDK